MLLHMHIRNIALIDDIDIDFYDGLNIMTGETGAGKSIIIGSLAIGLGDKFNRDLLRDETKDGQVELLFTVDDKNLSDKLSMLDIETPDDELLIERQLGAAGRCVTKINGNTVTTAKLKEVASLIIDLHAQHEQQSLKKASKHLEIVDDFGGDNIIQIKEKLNIIYRQYTELKNKLEMDKMDDSDKNKKVDFLKYQIKEIESANLKEDEEEPLFAQYKKMVNAKEILGIADSVYEITGYNSPRSAGEGIGHALSDMKRAAELDSDITQAYELLCDIDGMLNDFNRELSQYMKEMEFDGETFDEVEKRLNLIHDLEAKYGKNISDVLATLKEYKEEYAKLEAYDEYIAGLEAEVAELEKKVASLSDELSMARSQAAKKLCVVITDALKELNFLDVRFDMEFTKLDKYGVNGNDEAHFMISTNVGEPMKPLYDVASGGELSRVMLAIKACLAHKDETPTLIFDEIDVGISGITAQRVGEKMALIANNHQVICITHLPQIAALADSHFVIEKVVDNQKTNTNIRRLADDEAVDELARLIGGASITEATIASAREMKAMAQNIK